VADILLFPVFSSISRIFVYFVDFVNKNTTPEVLDRIANALKIETFQLFNVSATAEGALIHLESSILNNIKQIVKETVRETIIEESKYNEKK
jgi:hypothetical protein